MIMTTKIFSKLKTANRILRDEGLIGLLFFVRARLIQRNYVNNKYKLYSLRFTPLRYTQIVFFLKTKNLEISDLIVVPQIYKTKLKKRFRGKIISTLDEFDLSELGQYKRLIWATERVDRGALIARHFYSLSKPIEVLKNTGPARVWMHDHIKERVLLEEFQRQTQENVENFAYGIGADFGNLLQVLDIVKNVDGDFVEIGCFRGSSTSVMANYIEENNIDKKFFVYDYFDGFTYEEAENSLDSSWLGTHRTDGKKAVEERIKLRLAKYRDNFQILQRNIIEKDALKEVKKISFANIDVDLYEAIGAALSHVHKKLSKYGIIVVEDAGHTPRLLGAKVALTEFLEEVGENKYYCIQMESGQYILVRILD